MEKVVAGPERKSRRLNDAERQRVAYHEVGHALVGTYSQHADPVHKISIVPRGRTALGYTLQLPREEQFQKRNTRCRLIQATGGVNHGPPDPSGPDGAASGSTSTLFKPGFRAPTARK